MAKETKGHKTVLKRLKEVEESTKMIAKFVKNEVDKAEKKQFDPAPLEHSMEKLEEKVDSIPASLPSMRELKNRISEAENAIKKLSSTEAGRESEELDSLKKEVSGLEQKFSGAMEAVRSIEDKMGQIRNRDTDAAADKISHRVEEVEALLRNLEKNTVRPSDLQSLESYLNEELDSIKAELRTSSPGSVKKEIRDIKDKLEKEVDTKLKSVELRIRDLMASVDEIESTGIGEFSLRLKDMENKLGSIQNLVKNSTSSINNEFERMQNVRNRVKELENDLSTVSSRISSKDGRVSSLESQVKGVEAKVDENLEKNAMELHSAMLDAKEKLEARVDEKTSSIESSVSEKIEQDTKSVMRLRDKLRSLNKWVEEEMVRRDALEKDFQDMANEMESVKASMSSVMDAEKIDFSELTSRMEANQSAIEKMTRRLHGKVSSEDMEAMRSSIGQDLNDFKSSLDSDMKMFKHAFLEDARKMRQEVEEESAGVASVHKKFQDMEARLNNIADELNMVERGDKSRLQNLDTQLHDLKRHEESYIGSLESKVRKMESDINNMKKTSTDKKTEQSIEQKVRDISNKQLNQFAKVLDKKMPNLMTKDDFEKRISKFEKMAAHTPRTEQVKPLYQRVDMLERKVNEVARMMKSMYNRLPVVVE